MGADRRADTGAVEEQLPLTHLSYHVLLVVWDEPRHGYGIIKQIEQRSAGRLVPETGTLYTAIRRLQEQGLLRPVGGPGEGRRGVSWGPTALGRRVLQAEKRRLQRLVELAREMEVLRPRLAGAGRR
jgi:DNA-binding PadR family transcriptional regulator